MQAWQNKHMTVQDQAHYFRIRLSTIHPEKVITFQIFIFIDQKFILYLKPGNKISEGKVLNLHQKDSGSSFYLRQEDKEKYRQWVREEMLREDLDQDSKAKILRESSLAMMEDLFENPDVHQALDESKPLIKDFIQIMNTAPGSMQYLISLSGHDFYTYSHSLDVSIYSLGLGKALGFDDATLEDLGVSSLFHDVGKRNVSLDILCKKGALDDAEWEQMRRHPQYGLMILNEHPGGLSDSIKAACFEHHESWAGNGYPQQLKGQEIHPFARIVAITDTYDAMTTQRSYNTPLKPFDAVTMMKEKLAGRYDPEMLKAMHSVLFKLKAS
jgi:HD-GYP domain-containing protein (c-di-GMP phosphodiesterase class II)